MPAPANDFISLDGVKFRVKTGDRQRGERTMTELHRDTHAPRTEIDGRPGAENLDRGFWRWTLTDFSGGEGRLVFDAQSQNAPPHFWKTDGGIDTRVSGQFKMSPVPQVVLDNDGASTTTRTEGSALTKITGNEEVSGTNLFLEAVGEGGYLDHVPGAVSVTIVARFLNVQVSSGGSVTVRLRIHNQTDNVPVSNTTQVVENGPQSFTLSQNLTAAAAKTYRYFAEISSSTGPNQQGYVDYIEHTAGGAPPIDVRALVLGYEEKPFAYHWDGANTDIFVWDQANSMWDVVVGNVDNSLPVAATNSDKFQYLLVADRVIFQGTDAAAAQTTYTTAPASTTAGGIAVAGNRLYQLLFGASRQLGEIDLDGAGSFTSGSANWKVVMSSTDFPDEESADTTLRQRITSIGNGVRFFVNSRGGASQVYEFSEGAGRPLRHAALGGGYTMTCIHHFGGITWVGALYSGSGEAPSKDRASLWYIGADEVLRLAVEFRPDDPDETRPSFIATDQHYVYVQQGNHLWQYDPTRGAHVMDTHFGSSGEAGRGIAILDTKKWAAYSGEGVQVTQDSYPIDQTVYLYSPAWDNDVPDVDKILLGFDVLTSPLPANTTVTVEYEKDFSGTWVQAGSSITTDNSTFTSLTVSTNTSTIKFKVIRYRIGLQSSDGVSTPTIRAATMRSRVDPGQGGKRFEMTLLLDDDTSNSRIPFRQLKGHQKATLLRNLRTTGDVVEFKDFTISPDPRDVVSSNVVITGLEMDRYMPPQGGQYGEARVELEAV